MEQGGSAQRGLGAAAAAAANKSGNLVIDRRGGGRRGKKNWKVTGDVTCFAVFHGE